MYSCARASSSGAEVGAGAASTTIRALARNIRFELTAALFYIARNLKAAPSSTAAPSPN